MRSLSVIIAFNSNLFPLFNPRFSKASEPIDKPVIPLPIVEEEGEGEMDIIIINKNIKKRNISLDIIFKKRKRPRLLILIDGLPNWIIGDC